ncbi:NAD-binding protein [Rhodobacteraceae bacterium 2CG4]|uniref:NAD-binding protein n=1 Tax=Halovulum marinum TaxID=2662447 RepID=A0A6L5YX19_9RHOB|nr:NAD(P)-dependent oxidoreductase [Halovulum marinum]MSU88757.1 NAD-binding protein [Halovulum marinum]
MSDRPAIGFIGLGLMGAAMVGRLQDKGYALTVIANRARAAVDKAVDRGASEARTARELAAASDIVMLCVDTSASVEARMLGDDGVIAGLREGAVVIDFGTSLPGSTKALAAQVAQAGGTMLDAPLGRTPAHAVDGKLNVMAAGDRATYDAVKPVLDDLGENVFHLGAVGTGHTIKLINNFFAMTTACAMSEAFAMADRAGIDRASVYQVMAAGPLRSGMMDFVKAHAIDEDIQLAFSVANARKDIGYYVQMADELGAASQMSGAAKNALGLAKATGWGERMVPEMVDWFSALFDDTRKP